MAKLLETKLPYATGPVTSVTAALIFNRLVRILELSLGRVDIGATINANETQRNRNRLLQKLQLWTGSEWVDIYQGSENGVEGVASLGNVSISTGGSTIVKLGDT